MKSIFIHNLIFWDDVCVCVCVCQNTGTRAVCMYDVGAYYAYLYS